MTSILWQDLPSFIGDVRRTIQSPDLSPAWNECHDVITVDIADHFSQSKTPSGISWPPRVDDLSHPLLILSGRLLAAATGGSGHVFRVQPSQLEVGVDDSIIYALTQQHGDPSRNIPPRTFVGASAGAIDQCADIVAGFLVEGLR